MTYSTSLRSVFFSSFLILSFMAASPVAYAEEGQSCDEKLAQVIENLGGTGVGGSVYREGISFVTDAAELHEIDPNGEQNLSLLHLGGSCTYYVLANSEPRPVEISDNSEALKTSHQLHDLQSLARIKTEWEKITPTVSGSAQSGLVAMEALHTLGQIVVDRATNHALSLLHAKLLDVFGCNGEGAHFIDTCGVLRALRMQNIVASRDALLSGLIRDGARELVNNQQELEFAAHFVLPIFTRATPQWSDAEAHSLTRAAILAAWQHMNFDDLNSAPDSSTAAVAAGISVFAKCQIVYEKGRKELLGSTVADVALSNLVDCPIYHHLENLLHGSEWEDNQLVRAVALRIAGDALHITTMSAPPGKSVANRRLARATEFFFDLMCMTATEDLVRFGCPELSSISWDEERSLVDRATLLKHLLASYVANDTNQLIAGLVSVFPVRPENSSGEDCSQHDCPEPTRAQKRENNKINYGRALRLSAGLVQYASTYSEDNPGGASAQEQRADLLESLTRDFTDRRERGGDGIWSLGGALRGVGGLRWNDKTALHGPIDLSLGFAWSLLARESNWGFHVGVDLISLGQYLSFDENVQLQDPTGWQDPFVFGLTVAATNGHEMPFFLGLTGGFAPGSHVGENQGAFYFAGTIGVYVPLLDLN